MEPRFVQPILVLKNVGTHEDVVEAVALASSGIVAERAHLSSNPAWGLWLSGLFTKSVRKATQAQFDKITDECVYRYRKGDAQVAAFEPMLQEDFPKYISSARVSGLEHEHSPDGWAMWNKKFAYPILWINGDLGMSTGKTAAQVAHGAVSWVIRQDRWTNAAYAKYPEILIREVNSKEFESVCKNAVTVIEDAGLTEVEPGTATVAVTDYTGA